MLPVIDKDKLNLDQEVINRFTEKNLTNNISDILKKKYNKQYFHTMNKFRLWDGYLGYRMKTE